MRQFIRHIATVLTLGVIAMLLNSCTQPGGNIGVYFGSWVLESITIDGEDAPDYTIPVCLSFQSNIFDMAMIDYPELVGVWEETDGYLTLTAEKEWQPEEIHHYPPVMGWGDYGTVTLLILRKSDKHLDLHWTDPEGRVWKYYFKKAY